MTGPELRLLRESAGLTQTAAAELCGVSLRQWQHLEAGTRGLRTALERMIVAVLRPRRQ